MTRRQSADIHHLRGNPSNRIEDVAKDVKPDPIVPTCPAWLSFRGKGIWRYLSPELEKNALLTRRDREAFGFLCENAAVAQEALLMLRGKGNVYSNILQSDSAHSGRLRRHPAWIVYTQAKSLFLQDCKEFGLTPNARIGLQVAAGYGVPVGPTADEDDDESAVFG